MTAEIRPDGKRMGFMARSFSGASCVLAHRDIRSRQRVGAYGVDVEAFDRLIVEPLEAAEPPAMYVIDEIGKMEIKSGRFVWLIERLASGAIPLLATVPLSPILLVAQVQKRSDVRLVRMTAASRVDASRMVAQWYAGLGFAPARLGGGGNFGVA